MPYYVEIRAGERSGLLAGPLDTEDAAAAIVPRARDAAIEVDPDAGEAVFGTVALRPLIGWTVPEGRLNAALGLSVTPSASAVYAAFASAFTPRLGPAGVVR